MTTKHKTGITLLLTFAGLAWWYMRRMTRNADTLKTMQEKRRRAYDITPIRSRRGNIAMKGIIYSFIMLTITMCLIGQADDITKVASNSFRQIGYYKDKGKNRIFTIAYKQGTSEVDIKTYAAKLMHTPGSLTAAYFYPEGSRIPADGVTLADSVFKANDIIYELPGLSKWRYAYMHSRSGKIVFVNCIKNPEHDLSRKK